MPRSSASAQGNQLGPLVASAFFWVSGCPGLSHQECHLSGGQSHLRNDLSRHGSLMTPHGHPVLSLCLCRPGRTQLPGLPPPHLGVTSVLSTLDTDKHFCLCIGHLVQKVLTFSPSLHPRVAPGSHMPPPTNLGGSEGCYGIFAVSALLPVRHNDEAS